MADMASSFFFYLNGGKIENNFNKLCNIRLDYWSSYVRIFAPAMAYGEETDRGTRLGHGTRKPVRD